MKKVIFFQPQAAVGSALHRVPLAAHRSWPGHIPRGSQDVTISTKGLANAMQTQYNMGVNPHNFLDLGNGGALASPMFPRVLLGAP